jgi:hypothetical protein
MNIYQSPPGAIFAAIPVLHTIAESALEHLLENSLGSLLERALHWQE